MLLHQLLPIVHSEERSLSSPELIPDSVMLTYTRFQEHLSIDSPVGTGYY